MSYPARTLDAVVQEIDAGRRAALCVVVETRGSTPQGPGAMLAVDEEGRITGTVGGGCVEAEIQARALQLLLTGKGALCEVAFDHDEAFEDGLICGGSMRVAIRVFAEPAEARAIATAARALRRGEAAAVPLRVQGPGGWVEYRLRIEEPPRLVIAGGGHIGRVLAETMVGLGFKVAVVDDRQEFASAERFPPPIEPVAGDIEATLRRWPIDANTYVVIVTRGHKHDERALGAVLDSPARYVGMIGSRRKIEVIYRELASAGAKPEQLDRVHAPIGLRIGAVTTEEIALSIAAELVKERRAGYRSTVEGPFPAAGGNM